MTRSLAIAVLLLAGIHAAEAPGSSRVYIYDVTPAVRSNPVWVDGIKTAQLRRNRFFAVNLPPGEHTFSGRHVQQGITIDTAAGRTYYLRLDQVYSYPSTYDKITRQRAEDAAKIVNTLGAIDDADIFAREHVTLERPAE